MKLALDVCCGKGGATQAFRTDPDWHVLGIDNNPKMQQYWQEGNVEFLLFDVTVLDWEELKGILARKGFEQVEFLWASPPCERFSLACLQWPKSGIRKAFEIVGACLEAIAILKPKRWVLENPRARLRWFLGVPPKTIRYSDYDLHYKAEKVTDLWGNTPLPMVKGERRIKRAKIRDHLKRLHSWEHVYPHDKAERAMVPLGVSEAVKTATEAQS